MSFLDTLKARVDEITSSLKMGATDTLVGIDIGSSAIKAVQLRRSAGKVTLETYGSVSLAPYANATAGDVVPVTEEIVIKAITDLIRDARITAQSAVIAIPASASLLFTVHIPPVPESQYAPVITNEARKYIPVPLAEVSLDWWVLPESVGSTVSADAAKPEAHTTLTALVAAIQTQVMKGYQSIVQKIQLKSMGFEIELFSQVRSLVKREIGTVMLVDVGASATRIGIVREGIVRKTYIIHRGSHYISQSIAQSLGISFAEAEELKKKFGMHGEPNNERAQSAQKIVETSISYVTGELTGFLSQYERESHEAVEKVIVGGGGSELVGFIEHLGTLFTVPVAKADPFNKTDYPEFLNGMLQTIGPEFTVATGLALRVVQ